MNRMNARRHVWARNACRAGALVSAGMLILSTWVVITGGQTPAGAVTNNGSLALSPTSGNSDTEYQLGFAGGVPTACAGDSATNGYRVQGFMVPSGTDLGALTFSSVGPAGGQALLTVGDGDPFVNKQTDVTTGNISQLPGSFTWTFNSPSDFSAGSWIVGVACTQGTGAGMTKSYWTTVVAVTTDAATGGNAQFTWAVDTTTTSTTASTTTTTDGSGTTTTTDGSGTTTTTDGSGTTTTTDGSGTTTTTGAAEVSGSTFSGGTPSAASPVNTMGQLPYTGSSPLPMVAWAAALLVFGRMAMLLGKRPKVIGDDSEG